MAESVPAERIQIRRGGIPRGLAVRGLPLLSYGFRPFFLAAGFFGSTAMCLWLGAILWGWPMGGMTYGPVAWHAHEMLFGYTVAALSGFLLTTIPNWTGRLPVSGYPLLCLVFLWVAGRLAMAFPDSLGELVAGTIDSAFLLILLAVAAREILVGKNWRNLKIVVVLGLLATANILFHISVAVGGDPALAYRAAISLFIMLIGMVGGRIVPSFTRNWLARQKAPRLPRPFGRFDVAALIALAMALLSWTFFPAAAITIVTAVLAGTAHVIRLVRWRTASIISEPMLLILHVGYCFVPLGLLAIAAAAGGMLDSVSAFHVLTVGAIGTTTLAVMTRATLGHTGRAISASTPTVMCFAAIVVAAAVRPLAFVFPDSLLLILGFSGAAWVIAFALFTIEYGAIVLTPRASSRDV